MQSHKISIFIAWNSFQSSNTKSCCLVLNHQELSILYSSFHHLSFNNKIFLNVVFITDQRWVRYVAGFILVPRPLPISVACCCLKRGGGTQICCLHLGCRHTRSIFDFFWGTFGNQVPRCLAEEFGQL